VGFQFLLLDTASQIWFFILQYLETVQASLMFVISVLAQTVLGHFLSSCLALVNNHIGQMSKSRLIYDVGWSNLEPVRKLISIH